MDGTRLTIGAAARLLGVSAKTLRHYQRLGLLSDSHREANGYRSFGAHDLLRVQQIRRLQALGLSLGQVRAILGAPDNELSIRSALAQLYAEVSAEIAALEARRELIARLLAEEPSAALQGPLTPSPTMLELVLLGGLLLAFAPPAPRAVLLAGLALVAAYAAVDALSPLWTAHALDATHLRLRFGIAVRADIPRASIVGAGPAVPPHGLAQGAAYDAASRELRVGAGGTGWVRLELAAPQRIRVGLRGGGLVERLLLSFDEAEPLLAALGAPPAPPATASERSGATPEPSGQPLAPAARGGRPALLVAEGLTRRYSPRLIVDRLSLEVRAGEIYGFLGPNGAGKTTSIKLLVGLLAPDAGRALIASHNIWEEPLDARAALGYVPDRALLYERLTGREHLSFLAQLRGLPPPAADVRVAELLALLGLEPVAGQLSGSYSLGMRHKLALAGALLHRPRVLVLDEPLNGLDPHAAHRLRELLRDQADAGSAVLPGARWPPGRGLGRCGSGWRATRSSSCSPCR